MRLFLPKVLVSYICLILSVQANADSPLNQLKLIHSHFQRTALDEANLHQVTADSSKVNLRGGTDSMTTESESNANEIYFYLFESPDCTGNVIVSQQLLANVCVQYFAATLNETLYATYYVEGNTVVYRHSTSCESNDDIRHIGGLSAVIGDCHQKNNIFNIPSIYDDEKQYLGPYSSMVVTMPMQQPTNVARIETFVDSECKTLFQSFQFEVNYCYPFYKGSDTDFSSFIARGEYLHIFQNDSHCEGPPSELRILSDFSNGCHHDYTSDDGNAGNSYMATSPTMGISFSDMMTASSATCFANMNMQFVVAQANTPSKHGPKIMDGVCASLQAAYDAGIPTRDISFVPSSFLASGKHPYQQLAMVVSYIRATCNDVWSQSVWLDIDWAHSDITWTKSATSNREFMMNLAKACAQLNINCGISSSFKQWDAIFATHSWTNKNFAKLPLWYVHYGNTDLTLTDYSKKTFGGFSKPFARKYRSSAADCGMTVDYSVSPRALWQYPKAQ